jgi:hypothetical protein
MTPRQKARWEKAKAKGKPRFVIESAVAFGFVSALSASVNEAYWGNRHRVGIWTVLSGIALAFTLPALFSALGALWYWERNEKKDST